jgi:hypothetical protein
MQTYTIASRETSFAAVSDFIGKQIQQPIWSASPMLATTAALNLDRRDFSGLE